SLTPSTTARTGPLEVEGTLLIPIAPVSSLKKTKSENVPPVPTVTRSFAIGFSSIIKRMGLQSYFGRVEMLRFPQHDTQKHRHSERSEGSNPRLMLSALAVSRNSTGPRFRNGLSSSLSAHELKRFFY